MLTVHFPASIKSFANGEPHLSSLASPCNFLNVDLTRKNVAFQDYPEIHCTDKQSSFSKVRHQPIRFRRISIQGTTKDRMRHFHIYASSDEDYRSSHNIAISIFKRYRNVIDRGGGENLKEFICAGVNAYALGCTDEDLRKELLDMKDSGTEIDALQTYGGGTSVRFRILSEEVHECILWLSIIFLTILCTPQPTVVRWSSTSPVSTEIMLKWKGFCALIANAYYVKGMAWLPVKTLQLEQMAVMGIAEEPSVVASRMRLVFSTLEHISIAMYQLGQSGVTVGILLFDGTTKTKNLDENIGSLKVKHVEEEVKEISDAVAVEEVAGGRTYASTELKSWKFANTPKLSNS